jgi:hypothetical protein
MSDSADTQAPETRANGFIRDSVEYRSAMVDMLSRRLFGPTEETPNWITRAPTRTLYDGASTTSEERLVGPYVNPTGQEVLAVSPRSLYVTGVLWGNHAEESAEPDDEVVDETDGVETTRDRRRSDPNATETDHADVDDEALPDDIDGLGRRRSMAVSFRVPNADAPVTVSVTFGSYHGITCRFGTQDHRLWERTPHDVSCALPLEVQGATSLMSGNHTLGLGWRRRPDPADGSAVLTVWLSNETDRAVVSEDVSGAMFQVGACITTPKVLPYASKRRMTDPIDLLYRDVIDLAVGHGTDVVVDEHDDSTRIRTAAIPVAQVPAMTPDVTDPEGKSLAVGMRDLGAFSNAACAGIDRLVTAYSEWIEDQQRAMPQLADRAAEFGNANITQCRQFLNDMRAGWELVQHDDEARRCLADASRAMDLQRVGSTAPVRAVAHDGEQLVVAGSNPHLTQGSQSFWRPFQIAFVLASIPKIVDPEHPGRSNVDVIWMPTGGGKTEAYLGLAAFTILWERRQETLAGQNGTRPMMRVLMRYTLRLLTVQQFLRGSALICALEHLRAADPERYGQGEVRIGSWVGSSTTDNTRGAAVTRLKRASESSEDVGFLLTQCPWCGAAMGHPVDKAIAGYQAVPRPNGGGKRVLASCPDLTCEFRLREIQVGNKLLLRGLPVLEVDEDVYEFPPDFVIGTIDKVAMMWNQTAAQRLFGIKNRKRIPGTRPPALFIQDELHLITGPLGSLNGVIEMMLEELCTTDDGRAPLFVASTATTRNYQTQTAALYGRSAQLVPPPALDISDSFFSVVDTNQPPRTYVGVCSSGGFTSSSVQLAVLSTLAHFPPVLEDRMISDPALSVDPYWTNVCFFSSRASLGSLTSLVESKMKSQLYAIRRASGARSGNITEANERNSHRWVRRPREITATASENVSAVLADLALPADDPGSIDLCFATSMIEVGLDVSRLGLMTVIGQPKASSQYIQVTGRVGRSRQAPALVVDVLGTRTPRDRSHYEHFGSFHRRLYASVEGASVTPFTEPALERTAPTVAATLCQLLGTGSTIAEQVDSYWDRLTELFIDRATRCGDARSVANVSKQLARLRRVIDLKPPRPLVWSEWARPEDSFLFPFGAPIPADRVTPVYWRVLTSTRSVDPDAVGFIHDPGIQARQPMMQADVEGDDEELM